MNRRAALLVVLVGTLVVTVGIAFVSGVGPAPGGGGSPITDFPVGTTYEMPSGGDGAADATPSDPPPFSFTVESVEDCGLTCRDVTVTLSNNQDEAATGVTVYTRIFAGQDTTDADDLVWEGTEPLGTLDARASYTTTKRVELTLAESRKVQRNDGWITILTTVQSDQTTVTFKSTEQVT